MIAQLAMITVPLLLIKSLSKKASEDNSSPIQGKYSDTFSKTFKKLKKPEFRAKGVASGVKNIESYRTTPLTPEERFKALNPGAYALQQIEKKAIQKSGHSPAMEARSKAYAKRAEAMNGNVYFKSYEVV